MQQATKLLRLFRPAHEPAIQRRMQTQRYTINCVTIDCCAVLLLRSQECANDGQYNRQILLLTNNVFVTNSLSTVASQQQYGVSQNRYQSLLKNCKVVVRQCQKFRISSVLHRVRVFVCKYCIEINIIQMFYDGVISYTLGLDYTIIQSRYSNM